MRFTGHPRGLRARRRSPFGVGPHPGKEVSGVVVVLPGDEAPLVVVLQALEGSKALLVDEGVDADDGPVGDLLALVAEEGVVGETGAFAGFSRRSPRRRLGVGRRLAALSGRRLRVGRGRTSGRG